MRRSISKIATFAVVATVGLTLVAGAVGIVLSVRARAAATTALDTLLPAASTANGILADLVDQETGERGFVITGQAGFLQPYDAGRRAIGSLDRELRLDLRGDQPAERLLAESVHRYHVWLTTFAVPQITDVRSGDDAAAVAAERTGRGKFLFDAVRHEMAALSSLISQRQNEATEHLRSLDEDVVWLVVGMIGCTVIGAGVGFAVLRRWVVRPIQVLERDIGSVSEDDGQRGSIRARGPSEILYLGRNVESMRQRLRRQRRELGVRLHTVQVLQEALLPRQVPILDHFQFAARFVPAATEAEVGGDWYNVREVDALRLFAAVGDVAGSGLEAAALMASLQFAINAYVAEDPDPATVLNRLSRLFDLGSESRFATVLTCLIDAGANVARVASAGHLSPVVVAPGWAGGPVTVVPGPPIGLGDHQYTGVTVPLPPTGTLLLFSDGLVERRDEAVDVSIERLARLVDPGAPLEAMLDDLVVSSGSGGTDDTVLCGIRVRPAAAEPGPDQGR